MHTWCERHDTRLPLVSAPERAKSDKAKSWARSVPFLAASRYETSSLRDPRVPARALRWPPRPLRVRGRWAWPGQASTRHDRARQPSYTWPLCRRPSRVPQTHTCVKDPERCGLVLVKPSELNTQGTALSVGIASCSHKMSSGRPGSLTQAIAQSSVPLGIRCDGWWARARRARRRATRA